MALRAPAIFIRQSYRPYNFVHIDLEAGDTIGDLAARACVKLNWLEAPEQLTLHLALAGGCDVPTASEEDSARPLDASWSTARAGIASGAWLVARRAPAPPPLQLLPYLLSCAEWLLHGDPAERARQAQSKGR